MADYTQSIDFSTKDALASGQAAKVAKGADVDTELGLISDAIDTKYDSDDLSSQSEAEGLTLDTKIITPHSLNDVLVDNGGILGDLQALAAPGADQLLAYDFGTTSAKGFTLGAGLEFSGDTINLADAVAGAGLAVASSVISLDINELDADTPVLADTVAFEDTGGGADNKCTIQVLMDLLEANIVLTESNISDLGTYYSSGDAIACSTLTASSTITANGNITGDGATVLSGIETINVDATGDITKTSHGNYLFHKSTSYDNDQNGEITFSTSAASGGTTGDIWFRYTA